jgi:hypothetical protein
VNTTDPMPAASGRVQLVAEVAGHEQISDTVGGLLATACRGLPAMHHPDRQTFVQTVRPAGSSGLRGEGENLRYAAIVALGTAWLDPARQRDVLAGATAADLAATVAARGVGAADLGAAALSAWASAEIRRDAPEALFGRLQHEVRQGTAQPTVTYAWMLTALLAARSLADFDAAAGQAAERLLEAQGTSGIFPHALPRETLSRLRAHVGSYADQVYPIQALARYYAVTGHRRALDAANRCAARIVDLQGTSGQWWWHYDVRTGAVVEGYPVYSVHQHAMGPMALFDLLDAGGGNHRRAIGLGASWLRNHPETPRPLVDERRGVIWRKVGRREPRKVVRSLRSATTAVRPGLRLPWLDRVFPPGPIDYECRPYELGWLLYAWLADGVASGNRPADIGG